MSLIFTPSNAFLVLVGLKRMTRRIRRADDRPIRLPDGQIAAIERKTKRGWRLTWQVRHARIGGPPGERFAVPDFEVENAHVIQPGRGKRGLGLIYILSIHGGGLMSAIAPADARSEIGLLMPPDETIDHAAWLIFSQLWDNLYGAKAVEPFVWAMEIAPMCVKCRKPIFGLTLDLHCARCQFLFHGPTVAEWLAKAGEFLPRGREDLRPTGGTHGPT